LPNGNTLIDEGMGGRLFQITPVGDIVWEYVNPYPGRSIVAGKPFLNSLIYRAQAVPYDWVPAGTPHAEKAVREPDNATVQVPRLERRADASVARGPPGVLPQTGSATVTDRSARTLAERRGS
jgi:hypothetical protein